MARLRLRSFGGVREEVSVRSLGEERPRTGFAQPASYLFWALYASWSCMSFCRVLLLCIGLVGLWSAEGQAQTPFAFPGLPPFTRPTDVTNAGDGSGRLFVAEQTGRLYVFEAEPDVTTRTLFLDLSDLVFEEALEGGLLSVVFAPDYATSGQFVVHYVAGSAADPDGTRRSVLARYRVSASNPNEADPASGEILLEVGQPHLNHNGGKILFGPDGYLYFPLGDGGALPELRANGQDRTTLLGSVLRIDIDNPDPGRAYGIPADNPFVGNTEGWREEIWAWGFRSPWRSSFAPDGQLWIADVGENLWEEIDRVDAGQNYGWSEFEGTHCFTEPCDPSGKTFPLYEYEHSLETGFSITGGYVYRGPQAPGLVGRYVYSDFVTSIVWALDVTDPEHPVNIRIGALPAMAVAFGEGEDGELYALGFDLGRLFDIGALGRTVGVASETPPEGAVLGLSGPNPFRTRTAVRVRVARTEPMRVALYDILGREVRVVFEGVLAAGTTRTVGIEGHGLAAGVYTVRVATPSQDGALRLLRID